MRGAYLSGQGIVYRKPDALIMSFETQNTMKIICRSKCCCAWKRRWLLQAPVVQQLNLQLCVNANAVINVNEYSQPKACADPRHQHQLPVVATA